MAFDFAAIRPLSEKDALVLRRVPLFAELRDEWFKLVIDRALAHEALPNTQLFYEGDRPEFFHVLIDGLVELYSDHDNRSFGFLLLRAPSLFILAAVLLQAEYLNSARTVVSSRIILIPATTIRAVNESEPWFARALEREQALAYRQVLKELKNCKFRPMIERLANWLLCEMKPDGPGGFVHLPFTRRKLAAHLGTSPETLSRLFSELESLGVKSHFSEISIADVAALARLAHPDPLIDSRT